MLGISPNEPLWLLITILAIWRITALIAYEAGPFDMLVTLRRGLVRIGLGKLATCFYCLSVWTSCASMLVFQISRTTPLVILGISGAVAIIERMLTGSPTTGSGGEGGEEDGF